MFVKLQLIELRSVSMSPDGYHSVRGEEGKLLGRLRAEGPRAIWPQVPK